MTATVPLPATSAPASPPGAAGVGGAARGGLANLAGAGFAGVTGVAVTWLVARGLGVAHAGAFFAATAAFVLAGGVAKLGTQTALVYWPARLRATGREHLLGACLRTGLLPVTALAGVLGVALWFGAPTVAALTAGGEPAAVLAEHTAGLRALAVFLPAAALADALLTATRGYRVMRPTVYYERFLRSALQLLGVGALAVLALWGTAPGLPGWLVAWAAPYLPVVLLAGWALRRIHRAAQADRAAAPTGAGHGAEAVGAGPAAEAVGAGAGSRAAAHRRRRGEEVAFRREFWRFTGPRALASVAQLALQRVDVLLVAALGGLAAAAVYAVAGRFVVLVQFANQGISQAVQPRLAEALSTGDRRTANQLYQSATGWLVLTTWPVHLLVITFAPVYLALFGDGYAAGAPLVVVLACAMLIATGCGMVDMVLAMAGKTSWNLWNVLIALAVTIGLDVLLIPAYGALGAAIGLAVAVTVNNVLPLIQVGRALGLHPFGAGTRTAGALALGCFGVLPQIVLAVTGSGGTALLITLLIAVPVYLAAARRMRGRLALDSFRRPNPRSNP